MRCLVPLRAKGLAEGAHRHASIVHWVGACLTLGVIAVIAWLAGTRQLQAQSHAGSTAIRPAETGAGASRSGTAELRFLEVRSGSETWQGLDFGHAANMLLLLTREGQLQRIELDASAQVKELAKRFDPAGPADLESSLRKEFGRSFQVIRTPHYLVCHDTDESFAHEAAALVEDLYRSFTSYFGVRGMKLSKPQFPMVAVIFNTESEFRNYIARSPTAPRLSQITGYYSVDTNRVAFFNAAGQDAAKRGDARWQNLTTVIHEATHQIAFNSGCHRRSADNPVWLVEGLAMYFEAPQLQGKKLVWNEIGLLNKPRLDRFAGFRRHQRPADSLISLVSSDERFRSDADAVDAYAESWALTYFLVTTRSAQFHNFLRTVAARRPLEHYFPDDRLADFRVSFGKDLKLLDASFLRYVDELAAAR